MNITEFKGSFKDLARPTLFRVTGFGADRQLRFLCKAAQLPPSTLGVIEVPYMGRKIKVPGDRIYAEWTITIQNDDKFTLKHYFDEWTNKINDPELNIGSPSIEAIKEDGYVEQLTIDNKVAAKYKLVGAFPTEVAAIDVSHESNDTVEEFTVTLQYDFWVREI